jgi:hypothetical protein
MLLMSAYPVCHRPSNAPKGKGISRLTSPILLKSIPPTIDLSLILEKVSALSHEPSALWPARTIQSGVSIASQQSTYLSVFTRLLRVNGVYTSITDDGDHLKVVCGHSQEVRGGWSLSSDFTTFRTPPLQILARSPTSTSPLNL